MTSTRTLEIRVNQTGNAAAGLSAITGAAGNLGMVAGGVALAGIAALGAGIVSSIGQAMEAQDGLAQLNAVIESTGGAAGITAERVQAIALGLQDVTRFSDDAILSGQNMLLTFTNIGSDVFPMATEAMLNLSQAMGTDPQQAAIQLGKALNDPIDGVTALRRVGVMLTDAQEATIEKMVALGDVAGAQKVILAELETEFGGLAVAAGETAAGKLDIFWNKLGEVQEKIGGAFLPAIGQLADQISKGLDSAQFQAGLEAITGGFKNVVDFVNIITEGGITTALQRLRTDLALAELPEGMGEGITEALGSIIADAGRVGVAFSKMFEGVDINGMGILAGTLDKIAFAMEKIASASETAVQLKEIFGKLGGVGGFQAIVKEGTGQNIDPQATGVNYMGGMLPAQQPLNTPADLQAFGKSIADGLASAFNALVEQNRQASQNQVNIYLDSDQIAARIERRIGQAVYGQLLIGGPGDF